MQIGTLNLAVPLLLAPDGRDHRPAVSRYLQRTGLRDDCFGNGQR